MSLSDRVKDVLHSSETAEASYTEEDRRPPGSFPTDDMTPGNEQHREHNKLHKSNDPRGRGHAHTDSGVGLQEAQHEPAAAMKPVEEAYAPAEGYEQREEHAKKNEFASFGEEQPGKEDTTKYSEDPEELGTTAATTGTVDVVGTGEVPEHNTAQDGKQASNIAHKNPYWGDIPQGQGVYNTVSGHGSSQDEARRNNLSSAQDPTQDSEQRTFPLVTDRAREHHEASADAPAEVDPVQDDTFARESERTEETKDSHGKEAAVGAAGVAVTAAAGTAAYKATHDEEENTKEPTTEDTHEEKEKKKHGGILGLFHRSSKSERKEKEKEESKHEEKHHLSKAEEVAATGAAAEAYHHREESKPEDRRDQTLDDKSRSTTTDPAVAAAALAYSKHKDDTATRDTTSPTRLNETALHGNQGEYNTLGSGTASGIRTDDTAAAAGPTGPATDDRKTSNRDAAVFGLGAGAAGLGAGAYAAHELGKESDGKDEALQKDSLAHDPAVQDAPATNLASTSEPVTAEYPSAASHTETAPTSGGLGDDALGTAGVAGLAGAGAGAAGTAAAVGHESSKTAAHESSEPTLRKPSSEIPHVTEVANEGKYNLLASGTPSGVKLDDDEPKPSVRETLPTVADESSNRGAMATAGIAAVGAGAGAAAYAAAEDDDADDKPTEDEKKLRPESNEECTATTMIPGQVGSEKKVIHKCVNCGEENDIGKYFTEGGRTNV